MMRIGLGALLALALLIGCNQHPEPAPAPAPTRAPISTASNGHCWHCTPPHPTLAPTATPAPLRTLAPTATPAAPPAPTLAPVVLATAVATPSPLPTLLAALPTPTDPPPVGESSSGGVIGNGAAGSGGVITPSATPSPTPAPFPSPLNRIAWWGYPSGDSNKHVSPNNAHRWLQTCLGVGTTTAVTGGDTGGANIVTDCTNSYEYVEIGMIQPTTGGSVSTDPWLANYADGAAGGGAGTCPSVFKNGNYAKQTGLYAANWTSTDNTVNWGTYASGTTVGNDPAGMVVGWTPSYYRIFTNWNSTNGTSSMLAAVNQVIQNCSYTRSASGTVTQAIDLYTGFFEDNLHTGLLAAHAPIFDGHTSGGYPQGVNWAAGDSITAPSPTPSPCSGGTNCYASMNCNGGPSTGATFFNGAAVAGACGQTAYINANDPAGGSATYAADSAGTSSFNTAIDTFVAGLKHRNGSGYKIFYNGLWGWYDACALSNAVPNVAIGEAEFATLGPAENGKPNANIQNWQRINAAADLYACGAGSQFAFLDDLNSSAYNGGAAGTSAPGTAAYEMQLRTHFGLLMTLQTPDAHPNMMSSFPAGCNNACPYNTWTDTYAFQFTAATGRITPYPAEALSSSNTPCGENYYFFSGTNTACAKGGSRDPNISVASGTSGGGTCAGPPNCVFRTAYSHLYVYNQDKPTVTLAAVTGTSSAGTIYATATCLSAPSGGFEGIYTAAQSLTLTAAQQAQVTVASGTPNCADYNVYAGTSATGPFYKQNATPQTAGTSYLIPGTLLTVAQPPCGDNFDQRNWNATCTHDIGPAGVLDNLSGSSFTLSATNLQTAFGSTIYTQFNYVLTIGCVSNGTLTSSTAGAFLYPNDGTTGTASSALACAAGTYADVYNGSQMGAVAIAPTLGTLLADTESVIYSKGQP